MKTPSSSCLILSNAIFKKILFDLCLCPDFRFYVALTCGRGTSEPPPNVALELCVRFKDRQVLRRACVSGTWGNMEKDVPFFPFVKGQPFKVPPSETQLLMHLINVEKVVSLRTVKVLGCALVAVVKTDHSKTTKNKIIHPKMLSLYTRT